MRDRNRYVNKLGWSKVLELNKIYNRDCRDGLQELDENSIDAIVTDPPYEIGFMGKSWDASGIAYNIQMWKEVFYVLKPGGHLLSFGGSRTYHRMACAIEDAGFEIRDQIMWVYGSGFPKSLDISKAIDKMKGENTNNVPITYRKFEDIAGDNFNRKDGKTESTKVLYEHIPQSYESKEWSGWGTALKPAHEPIVLARKPLSEKTVAENVLRWGVGGLNIDGCRISHNEPIKTTNRKQRSAGWNHDNCGFDSTQNTQASASSLGRFPANFIHDGSDEVVELFPSSVSKPHTHNHKKDTIIYGGGKGLGIRKGDSLFDDSGSASRFFYCAKASKTERDKGLEGMPTVIKQNPMRSANGTGKKNFEGGFPDIIVKNNHPTVKPLALIEYLIKLITIEGQIVLDPFVGSGTTALTCKQLSRKFIGFEINPEYCSIAEKRISSVKTIQKHVIEG